MGRPLYSARACIALMLSSLMVSAVFVSTGHAAEQEVRFNRDIRPILSDKCFRCHGPDSKHRKADLRLDDAVDATRDRKGHRAIFPGELTSSEVWARIRHDDPSEVMPPPASKKKLTDEEIDLIGKWIDAGAVYEDHWSFTAPSKPAIPKSKTPDWIRNEIDAFILARLEREGISPSESASKETLIRRVTLDLTGLPPTIEEVDAFIFDTSDKAYERLVDRLLMSDRFGERMAVLWLDAARYGDSSVFHADGPRDMWPWRDWVIRAYNANMPFDEFTIAQIAGDQRPNASIEDMIASGFNRNHGTTDEGGAIDEEYRVEYAVDRVMTTSTVWLGLSMECGQCHDHKYDPISQEEYYKFFAFFNQSQDRGMQTRNGNADPKINVPNPLSKTELVKVKKQVELAKQARDAHKKTIDSPFGAWLAKAEADSKKVKPLPEGQLVHVAFDEGSGKIAKTGAAKDASVPVKGPAKWADGKFGKALKLDGKTFVDFGGLGDFERDQSFSYGAWVWSENGSGAVIARMQDNAKFRGFDLYLAGNQVSAHIINTWPENAIKVTTEKKIANKKWHHLFVTYDGSSKASGVKLYIDGVEEKWKIEADALSATIRTKASLHAGRRSPSSQFKGMIDDLRIYPRKLSSSEIAALSGSDPIGPILAVAGDKRSKEQKARLVDFYLNNHDATYGSLVSQVASLEKRAADLSKPISSVMIMKDMGKPRPTYVLMRGNYASPDKKRPVQPGTPAFLNPFPKESPRNRYGLAKWLVDPKNPLTSRVTVNRMWQTFFGTGIVKTSEDFGSLGDWPTHPDLLDWLASDFVQNGWNVKRLIRQIVTSNTYRQNAKTTREAYQHDPQNRLLARGARFRLSGEFIRDQALFMSDLLVEQIGGRGVKPYQPPGLWNEVSLGGNVRFVQDHGEKLYRRSMYTYWKRSSPAPAMLIFDVPTREKCVVRRPVTNTPLQALVTLNDVQFVEASRNMAEKVLRKGGKSPEMRATYAYRLATSSRPKPAILNELVAAYKEEFAAFKAKPDEATKLLNSGESHRDKSLDPAEHAAWTIVCSLILNLDKTLTRG